MDDAEFIYLVNLVNDIFVNSGESPMNSICRIYPTLKAEGVEDQILLKKILMKSWYAEVEELNLHDTLALF